MDKLGTKVYVDQDFSLLSVSDLGVVAQLLVSFQGQTTFKLTVVTADYLLGFDW